MRAQIVPYILNRIQTAAGAAFLFFATGQAQATPTDAEVEAALRNVAETWTAQLPLPKMMDDGITRFDAVSVGPGKRFNHRFTLVAADLDQWDKAAFEANIREKAKADACPVFAAFVPYGVAAAFRYDAPSGEPYVSFEIDLSDC